MAEKLKRVGGDGHLAQTVMDSAHQIWLAGLGAFAKAQGEGKKLFDNLVKEGEAAEARTRKMTAQQMDTLGKKAAGTWDRLEQVFEDRVSKSLNRLGVPTHRDISALSKEVAELHAGVKQLLKPGKAAAKPSGGRQARG